jgi:hypothetical protein
LLNNHDWFYSFRFIFRFIFRFKFEYRCPKYATECELLSPFYGINLIMEGDPSLFSIYLLAFAHNMNS